MPDLVQMVTSELEEAGRFGTVAGRRALGLAQRMAAASHDTGSAYAALDKQLGLAMAEALRGAAAVGDPIDELRARRDRKRRAG